MRVRIDSPDQAVNSRRTLPNFVLRVEQGIGVPVLGLEHWVGVLHVRRRDVDWLRSLARHRTR